MGLVLQRHLGPVQSLQRQQWTEETVSGRPAICCPRCERVSDLPIETRVLKAGEVSPVWTCPYQDCSAMDFIRLECWGEEVLK